MVEGFVSTVVTDSAVLISIRSVLSSVIVKVVPMPGAPGIVSLSYTSYTV